MFCMYPTSFDRMRFNLPEANLDVVYIINYLDINKRKPALFHNLGLFCLTFLFMMLIDISLSKI